MARLWTIGHSTRSIDTFIELLAAAGIERLADVRRFPGSRRLPHFGREALAAALGTAGLQYVHLPDLGGRRTARPDSRNTAWRDPSFRGYADYMATPEFNRALADLISLAVSAPTAIMCAEALWWQCHRGLIADRLKSDGHEVLHILGAGKIEPHPYTSAAQIVDGALSYAAPQTDLFG
jgi:uncharacterized protein (DUF488 family)